MLYHLWVRRHEWIHDTDSLMYLGVYPPSIVWAEAEEAARSAGEVRAVLVEPVEGR